MSDDLKPDRERLIRDEAARLSEWGHVHAKPFTELLAALDHVRKERDTLQSALEEARQRIKALDAHATDVGVRWKKLWDEEHAQFTSTQAELAEARLRREETVMACEMVTAELATVRARLEEALQKATQ